MKRAALDRIAREHRLSVEAVDAALALSGCRPNEAAWRAFGIRLMGAAGIAAIASGVLFFIAANWQYLGQLGRFVPVEAALLACVALACWREPPHALGRGALVLAILLTGGLLALFGQTYQTGADVFELFFAWAALALPFALAARAGAAWATWWIVVNIGLALFCGFLGPNHLFWAWLDRGGIGKPAMLLAAGAVNLAAAMLFAYIAHTRFSAHAPRWLVRMLWAIGFAYGTVASIASISSSLWASRDAGVQDTSVVLVFAVLSIAVAIAALRAKRDVFPMAIVIGRWIAITTAMLVVNIHFRDVGAFFVVAVWLIATSTAAGFLLMRWVREWRVEEDESVEVHA